MRSKVCPTCRQPWARTETSPYETAYCNRCDTDASIEYTHALIRILPLLSPAWKDDAQQIRDLVDELPSIFSSFDEVRSKVSLSPRVSARDLKKLARDYESLITYIDHMGNIADYTADDAIW